MDERINSNFHIGRDCSYHPLKNYIHFIPDQSNPVRLLTLARVLTLRQLRVCVLLFSMVVRKLLVQRRHDTHFCILAQHDNVISTYAISRWPSQRVNSTTFTTHTRVTLYPSYHH